jgi:hypothetical protein
MTAKKKKTKTKKTTNKATMSELISKATQTVQDAHSYLNVREGLTTDPEERVGIQDWRTMLRESAAKLKVSETPTSDPGPTPMRGMLSDQLELTHQHILGLHERSDYGDVHFVLSTLRNQLHVALERAPGGAAAGPPGPGGGPYDEAPAMTTGPDGPGGGPHIAARGESNVIQKTASKT